MKQTADIARSQISLSVFIGAFLWAGICYGKYDRDDWQHWIDIDGDCRNTRHEILIAESIHTAVLKPNGCTVLHGLWIDPYSGKRWYRASDVDIDHLVPLKWANDRGGEVWSHERKREFANDWDNLLVVEDGLNQKKGADGPDKWMPPNEAYRCAYVSRFDFVVKKYGLRYRASEADFIAKYLEECF